jgi:hypothetical protein
VHGPEYDGTTVVWVHPAGKASLLKDGKLVPAAQQLIDKKAGIVAVDVFLTGEFKDIETAPVDARYAGYTFGYNRPVLANRVRDILTAVAFAKSMRKCKTVHLVGFEEAGPWVLLTRGLCGDAVTRTAADVNQFRFEKVTRADDVMMLPGALKYGGLPAFAALAAPGELFVHNHRGTGSGQWLNGVYQSAGATNQLQRQPELVSPEKVAAWLLR